MELDKSAYFLEFLVKEGQTPLALSLAKNKLGNPPAEDGTLIDLAAMKAKYERIQGYIKQRILPQLEGGQSLQQIEESFLNFLKGNSLPTEDEGHVLEEVVEESLMEKLVAIDEFCKEKNLYPYTPVMLWVLLNQKPSKTYRYFERFRPGLGISLQLDFDEFVNQELPENGHSYEPIAWEKMRSVKNALQIAWLEEKDRINEKYFLLGIVLSPSNTITALKGAHGFDKWEFLEYMLEMEA